MLLGLLLRLMAWALSAVECCFFHAVSESCFERELNGKFVLLQLCYSSPGGGSSNIADECCNAA